MSQQAHINARQDHPAYLAEGFERIRVPDAKVSWKVNWPEYDLIEQPAYNHSAVINQYQKHGDSGWAEHPEARTDMTKVQSYVDQLPTNSKGETLNPGGRTGIKDGRGLLGKSGPNFAADPVIFLIDPKSNDLKVLLITRKDTGELAIPGGMVDFGELVTQTLTRELREETGADINMNDAIIIYRGYVDDPRNTDKAWMETTVATKLLEPEVTAKLKLQAGDDAGAIHLMTVNTELFSNLYASHGDFLRQSLESISIKKRKDLIAVQQQVTAVVSS